MLYPISLNTGKTWPTNVGWGHPYTYSGCTSCIHCFLIESNVKLQVPFQVPVKVEVTHDEKLCKNMRQKQQKYALIYEWQVYAKKIYKIWGTNYFSTWKVLGKYFKTNHMCCLMCNLWYVTFHVMTVLPMPSPDLQVTKEVSCLMCDLCCVIWGRSCYPFFSRPGQSQRLLYKHLCHSFINWFIKSSFF